MFELFITEELVGLPYFSRSAYLLDRSLVFLRSDVLPSISIVPVLRGTAASLRM